MAGPNLVQYAKADDNNTPAVFASNTTVGNWLVALCMSQGGQTTNTGWTEVGTYSADPDGRLVSRIACMKVTSAGTNYTPFTDTNFGSMFIVEIASAASSTTDLVAGTNIHASAAPGTYGSVANSKTVDGRAIIMVGGRPGGTTITAGSGWTTVTTGSGSNRTSLLCTVPTVAAGNSVTLNQSFSGSEQEAVLSIIVVNADPVSAETAQSSSYFTNTVSNGYTLDLRASDLVANTIYQYAADVTYSSSLTAVTVNNKPATLSVASDMVAHAVVRGHIENPRLRAWTFVLDGHIFYVLRLGDDKTLLYDVSTQQWSWWSSGDNLFWRVTTGFNWRTPGNNAFYNGSNIICGDDTFGLLWALDPEQGYDENADDSSGPIKPYVRVVTGQITTRSRQYLGVYQAYLTASVGDPKIENATITLKYSDDLGHTFVDAGAITVEPGNYFQEFAWRSLGKIGAPGRLFQLVDYGAFARIDELDIDDGTAS